MAIETICQGCGQRLRVGDEHAGKKARCPNCQTINPIPGPEVSTLGQTAATDPYAPKPLSDAYSPAANAVATASPFSSTAQPSSGDVLERWTLKIDDGREFGPIPREELDKWYAEGRVTPACQVFSGRDQRWRPAGELYPALGLPAGGMGRPVQGSNPFSDHAQAANPYRSGTFAPTGTFSPARTWSQPHNGVLILVLGLLGCMFCALLGPVAAFMGHQSLSEIRSGRMDPEGHGLVLAGTILGWIGTVQILIGCGFFALIAIAGAAGN